MPSRPFTCIAASASVVVSRHADGSVAPVRQALTRTVVGAVPVTCTRTVTLVPGV